MAQTRIMSFVEAIINTAIGFLITMIVLPIVNLICGIEMTLGQASLSTFIFTIISVLRGYLIRRFFEGNIAHVIITKLKSYANRHFR